MYTDKAARDNGGCVYMQQSVVLVSSNLIDLWRRTTKHSESCEEFCHANHTWKN